ncbi:nascent polypeptide-associated complex protein [Candidatus Woesearchaeota archaeon]|nr:nascent polypeptide-associated complex protein [Candidatus Woesearchaeota archaeon]
MIPGMNPRKMQQMMKRMGIQQNELDAKEVIIKLKDKEIIISNPSVSKVNMMGQQTYQIVGEETERSISTEPDISEDDVKTVMNQTEATEEEATEAIKKHKGDLAESILDLKS